MVPVDAIREQTKMIKDVRNENYSSNVGLRHGNLVCNYEGRFSAALISFVTQKHLWEILRAGATYLGELDVASFVLI